MPCGEEKIGWLQSFENDRFIAELMPFVDVTFPQSAGNDQGKILVIKDDFQTTLRRPKSHSQVTLPRW